MNREVVKTFEKGKDEEKEWEKTWLVGEVSHRR
jgi:hypothetical protein